MVSSPIDRRTVLMAGLACWLCLGTGWAGAAEAPPLEVAIVPFLSARTLIATYEPVRAAIQAALGRPTYLATAPDFRGFIRRTATQHYGLVITAPHLARLAEVENGYRPVLQWRSSMHGVFLVERDSPIRTLTELRGHTVETPDPLAIITMLGVEALTNAGLAVDADVKLSAQPSHNAALLAVLHGEATAALVSATALNYVDPAIAAQTRILAATADVPMTLVFMASPGFTTAEEATLRDAMTAFATTDAGRDFLRHTGYEGVALPERDGLAAFDRFLPRLRQLLAAPAGGS